MERELRRELDELQKLIKDLGLKIAAAAERAKELEARLLGDDAPPAFRRRTAFQEGMIGILEVSQQVTAA